MIKRGISLSGSDHIDLGSRLELSRGAVNASSIKLQNTRYTAYAHIPNGQWCRLTLDELDAALNQASEYDCKNSIRVFTIPEETRKLFEMLQLGNAGSLQEINEMVAHQTDVLIKLEEQLQNMIKDYEMPSPEKKTYIQGFFHSKPGYSTVTVDRNQQYVGLHIDYSVDLHKLYKTDTVNRLCINIGKSARYFQYVNQNVNELERMINEKYTHDFRSGYESRDLPGIVEKFFKYYPDYAILKFRLEPYEAYIAPSDNMIHDGCSENMPSDDVSLSLLGFLNTIENSKVLINDTII
jgi:hypothetical protein